MPLHPPLPPPHCWTRTTSTTSHRPKNKPVLTSASQQEWGTGTCGCAWQNTSYGLHVEGFVSWYHVSSHGKCSAVENYQLQGQRYDERAAHVYSLICTRTHPTVIEIYSTIVEVTITVSLRLADPPTTLLGHDYWAVPVEGCTHEYDTMEVPVFLWVWLC